MQRFIAPGHIGIGQENLWVPLRELSYRLATHFGQEVGVNEVLESGDWQEALDVVEIFLGIARDIAWRRYNEILGQIGQAFRVSGSVYGVIREGTVALRADPETTERVAQAVTALKAVEKAQKVFKEAAAGLTSRRMRPEDVVRDVCVAFEEFLKEKTGEKDFPSSLKALRDRGVLTPTQAKIIDGLYGFRSEGFGVTHAGKARTPSESDALWYLDTVSAQIMFLDRVVK